MDQKSLDCWTDESLTKSIFITATRNTKVPNIVSNFCSVLILYFKMLLYFRHMGTLCIGVLKVNNRPGGTWSAAQIQSIINPLNRSPMLQFETNFIFLNRLIKQIS